jgi:hypothetical protein
MRSHLLQVIAAQEKEVMVCTHRRLEKKIGNARIYALMMKHAKLMNFRAA